MPKTINRLLSPFVMQSDDVDMYTRTSVSLTNETQRVDPERYLISFGEPQVSLRALLRRATLCYMDTLPYSATASDSLVNYLAIRAVYPISPGYDPKGVHTAVKLSNPGAFIAYNWVNYSPIDFISSCFAARRGSITHHFNINAGKTPMGYLSCAYAVTPHLNSFWNGSSLVTTTSTVSTLTKSVGGVLDNGASGCDMTTGFVMPAMSVMVPHNTFARFMNTNPKYSVEGAAADGTDNMTLKATFTTRDAVLTQVLDYIQIGTDYSVSYFINVPPLYRYSALPGTT